MRTVVEKTVWLSLRYNCRVVATQGAGGGDKRTLYSNQNGTPTTPPPPNRFSSEPLNGSLIIALFLIKVVMDPLCQKK